MENVVVFSDDGVELEVSVTPEQDTVWLSLDQIVLSTQIAALLIL